MPKEIYKIHALLQKSGGMSATQNAKTNKKSVVSCRVSHNGLYIPYTQTHGLSVLLAAV